MKKNLRLNWLVLMLVTGLISAGCSAAVPESAQSSQNSSVSESISYTLEDIPEYSGEPYTIISNNDPDFSESDLSAESFEEYGELDGLGRCTYAYACVSVDTMPTEERGDISSIKPTGWQSVQYDNVDGKYLYNRCHLIGFQLTAENANERNLITGTRYMNVEGMLPFENMIADYINETGNHVLYRVTPVFRNNDLVAEGVIMEAESIEDNGEGILFNVFVYNVQPGIEIDYATGNSTLVSTDFSDEEDVSNEEIEIRGNSRSKIYHMPGQQAYDDMADSKNLVVFHSEQEAIDAGYRKAKR